MLAGCWTIASAMDSSLSEVAVSVASTAFHDLVAYHRSDLERLLLKGETPSCQVISGWSYRGYNYAWITGKLGIRTFIKDFYTTESGEVFGRSTILEQDGLGPFGDLQATAIRVKRRIRYRVRPVDPSSRDSRYPRALLLDYGAAGNRRSDPASWIRDYLVRVEPGNDELLLGKAYFAIGPLRLFTSFFLIERIGPLDTSTLNGQR